MGEYFAKRFCKSLYLKFTNLPGNSFLGSLFFRDSILNYINYRIKHKKNILILFTLTYLSRLFTAFLIIFSLTSVQHL